MSRVDPTWTKEGLRDRLKKMERQIADLNRRGEWRFEQEVAAAGGNLPFYVAASDASDESKALSNYVCTGTDDHLVIQQAIDDIRTAYAGTTLGPGAAVWLSEGTFTLGDSVNLGVDTNDFFLSLRGSGTGSTFLRPAVAGTLTAVLVSRIDGNGLSIQDARFIDFSIGIDLDIAGSYNYVQVRSCHFSSCTTGVHLSSNQHWIRDCSFDGCTTGIYLDGSARHLIEDNHFYGNTSDIAGRAMDTTLIQGNQSGDSARFLNIELGDSLSASSSSVVGNVVSTPGTQAIRVTKGSGVDGYFGGMEITGNRIGGGGNVDEISVATFTSSAGAPPLILADNSVDGSVTVDVKCEVTGNYIAGGLTVGAACPEGVVSNNWLGDASVNMGAGTLTDSSGNVDTGAGNYLDGTWTGGPSSPLESDSDGERLPLADASSMTKGYVGYSGGGGFFGIWAGDADGAINYDTPMVALYSTGQAYLQNADGSAWISLNSPTSAVGGLSAAIIDGALIKFFSGTKAGIDGTATPSTVAELADVLVDLGIIAGHTIT